jgi:ribosomal protein S18 acetylase RimI-like enzyme
MKASPINIRKMGWGDLNRVEKIGLKTAEFKTGTSAPQFYSYRTLKGWVKSKKGILLVAEMNGKMVGFGITAYNPDSRDGYIHCLINFSKNRKRGVGKVLIKETLDSLTGMGCNHVFALVKNWNDPAQNLFSRAGFEVGDLFRYCEKTL